ncbi:glycoside hydrolase [Flagelloscypha sp. PMI_526]|nr:glycoside hydrolase [Flagelloscypha sp. PMI_526]
MSYNYQGVAASSTDHLPGPGPIGDKPPGPYGYGFAPDAVRSTGGIAKWKIIAGVVGVLAIIGIAVGVGVGVSMANKNKGSSSSSGLAYTPENSLLPNCGNKLEFVYTGLTAIQSALVLEAIQRTKVNLNVYLGNYVVPEDADTVYNRQKTAIQQAIQTYGTDHIAGITVGNEFMLNYLNANGATDPDSTVGNAGAAILMKYYLPVDYGLSNVHPCPKCTLPKPVGLPNHLTQAMQTTALQMPLLLIFRNSSTPLYVKANTNGTKYFYFEPWKDKQFGGVEGWWGLFNSEFVGFSDSVRSDANLVP